MLRLKYRVFHKEVKRIQSEAERLISLDVIVDDTYLDYPIVREFNRYQEHLAYERMDSILIDDLKNIIDGVFPVNALKNYGIKYVGQLNDFNIYTIKTIPGIGEVTGRRVMVAYKQIFDSLVKDTSIRLESSASAYPLLKAIFHKRHYLKNKDEIIALNREIYNWSQVIENLLVDVKRYNNYFLWIFRRKEPQVKVLYDEMKLVDVRELVAEYNLYYKQEFSKEEVFKDFESHAADYYALLDSLDLIEVNEHEYISDDLVRKIESFKLDLTNLKVVPRGYQNFASKYILVQKNTLIGDEMGLGKTIEAIVALNHLYQKGHKRFLVICPLSVLVNWKREIEKWSELPTKIYHGNQREFNLDIWRNDGGVLLTTFDTAKYLVDKNISNLDMMVVDEAHYIKNPKAQRTKAVYILKKVSKYTVFMTGTPLENNVDEMIGLIKGLQDDVGSSLNNTLFVSNPDSFRQAASPVYLRRNRDDVLAELPELEIRELWVPFSEVEYKNYIQAVGEGNLMKMRRMAWTGLNRRESPKLDALLDLCDQAQEDDRKVLVFSYFKDVLYKIEDALGERAFGPITGQVSNQQRQELIDAFTQAPSGSVLISQIMAGGVGLNIQAASVVVICEPQYKPSTENQAISRAYRMGQVNNVLVYRLLTEDSIDERILELIYRKSNIFDKYAKDSYLAEVSESATNLSDDETLTKILEIEKEMHLSN